MGKYRRDRINDEMMKEMNIIMRNVKDPRVSDAFITITAVDVTADLKYAKVWYSALSGDEKEIKQGLKAANGFIRGQIARIMNLRITPELTFARDMSIAHGARISEVLSHLTISKDDADGDEDTVEADGNNKENINEDSTDE